MRGFTYAIVCLACYAARRGSGGGALASVAGRPPNVVLVIADDLGRDDLGAYGAPGNVTPALDAMAREGVVFRAAQAASALCGPSRASLLTGRTPLRHGVLENHNVVVRDGVRMLGP